MCPQVGVQVAVTGTSTGYIPIHQHHIASRRVDSALELPFLVDNGHRTTHVLVSSEECLTGKIKDAGAG